MMMAGSMVFRRFAKAAAAFGAVFAAPAAAEVIEIPDAAAEGLVASYAAADEAPVVIGDADAEFRQLYAEWQASDKTGARPERVAMVAVPSRMPLDGSQLTSKFGMRNHPVLGTRRKHNGIDLAAPTGTPVFATADGIVEKAKHFSSYGLYVQIDHGAELETRYAHMSRLAVEAGERVQKGQLVGYVGSTGRSTGPHLHYEVRIAGHPVDPLPYMAMSSTQQELEGGRGGPD